MNLWFPYLILVLLGLLACSTPSEVRSSAFAKTPYSPIAYDQDTLILDTQDTLLLDAIGQLYHWSEDHSLEKILSVNQLGQSDTIRYRYLNPRLGELTSVDLTNPIRPLLFYQDAQTVVWLNRNLSEWRSVNLFDLGYSAIDAVAYAPNEGLWLFASDVQRIIQVDLNGRKIYQSAELNQVFNQAIRAEQLVANTQQLALRTKNNRLFLFGPFAGYRTEILQGGTSLHLSKDRLLFYENAEWWQYAGANLPIEPVENMPRKELVSLRSKFALYKKKNRYWRELSANE